MFLVEGIITLIVGIAAFFLMPTSPGATKAPWRPNGYLTDDQAKIVTNRNIRDDPRKVSLDQPPISSSPSNHGVRWDRWLMPITGRDAQSPGSHVQIDLVLIQGLPPLAYVSGIPHRNAKIMMVLSIPYLNTQFTCSLKVADGTPQVPNLPHIQPANRSHGPIPPDPIPSSRLYNSHGQRPRHPSIHTLNDHFARRDDH